MEEYLDIPPKVLDRITIRLRYETAEGWSVLPVSICYTAQQYWSKKYNKKMLPITPRILGKFGNQPDSHNSRGRIDVAGWICGLYNRSDVMEDAMRAETVTDNPVKQARWLKAFLLWYFERHTFNALKSGEATRRFE